MTVTQRREEGMEEVRGIAKNVHEQFIVGLINDSGKVRRLRRGCRSVAKADRPLQECFQASTASSICKAHPSWRCIDELSNHGGLEDGLH